MTTTIEDLKAAIEATKAMGLEPEVNIVYSIGASSTSTPDTPPPPPPAPAKPERTVIFKDTSNNLTPTYDLPDISSTKCLIWDENDATESCPPAGHKGMPKEDDLIAREAHARNMFKEWAWLPRQILQKASLKNFSFPDTGTAGQDLSNYPGMWVRRESLATATSDAWIDSLVAYLKTQW